METYNEDMPAEYPNHLEAGTLNAHGIAGLHEGVAYIQREGIATIREKELSLMEQFKKGIESLPGVKLYGYFQEKKRCPIVSMNLYAYDSAMVSDELFTRFNIATRAGGHCAPLMHKALNNVEQGCVRFSFSHFNTEEEVAKAVEAIRILSEEG